MKVNPVAYVSVLELIEDFGDYGEQILSTKLVYSGKEIIYPLSQNIVKEQFGITISSPHKVIIKRPLPKDVPLRVVFGGKSYDVVGRSDYNTLNILVIDTSAEVEYGK